MEQLITNDGEPLLEFLPVGSERDSLVLKRHCPFIGLMNDAETVMAFPTSRNCCHRLSPARVIRTDYQRTHCLTFAHRHCQVLLAPSSKTFPPELRGTSAKNRSIFVIFSVASLFMLLAIAFLLFGGWQWTSASDWFFDPDRASVQGEMIGNPGVLQANPDGPAPTLQPTDLPPASEYPPVKTPVFDQAPEPAPTIFSPTET